MPRCLPTLLVAILLVFSTQPAITTERNDITDQLEFIGTPFLVRYPAQSKIYARNVWDMVAYHGQLYFGGGNSSNLGPATNAGPVPVISYDPAIGKFSTPYIVDEEQIDSFFIFDDKLYIPGHDPRGGWDLGNLYTFSPLDGWRSHRTIPRAIHTYSLASFQGDLFAALGTKKGSSLARSMDDGSTWTPLNAHGNSRIYEFLVVDDTLYAVGTFPPDVSYLLMAQKNEAPPAAILEYNGANRFEPREDLAMPQVVFPNGATDGTRSRKIVRPVQHNDKAVFIGAETHNDHQAKPFGVFVASSLKKGAVDIGAVPLPPGSRPWDLLKDGDTVYLLLDHPEKTPRQVSVLASTDLISWTELCFFTAPTFARSFALLNDTFYFSLGSEIEQPGKWRQEELHEQTGQVYRWSFPAGLSPKHLLPGSRENNND